MIELTNKWEKWQVFLTDELQMMYVVSPPSVGGA